MKVVIGSDHGGYLLKEELKKALQELSIEYEDYGVDNNNVSVDYPDIAQVVCNKIIGNKADKAILICGTGIGMSIAANKINGIRAALCNDVFSAEHNNANVLCLGERVIGAGLAKMILINWLNTEFTAGRHEKRVDKLTSLEEV